MLGLSADLGLLNKRPLTGITDNDNSQDDDTFEYNMTFFSVHCIIQLLEG